MLAPIVEPMAAVAILMVTEVRMPATVTARANGNSTWRSTCTGDMPMPRAASRTAGSMPCRPARVLRRIGSRPYSIKASMVGKAPKPSMGTAKASTATGGKVWPIAATWLTSGKKSRPQRRDTMTAAATPTRIETQAATVTISRWLPSRLRNDARV
ncbi:hypothetical protein D9M68_731110 [compost metagenome]